MNDEQKRLADNLRSDAWRNSAAAYFELGHDGEPIGPQRSTESHTIIEELWWAARVNEAADRKLADLLRRAQARLAALETLVLALQAVKRCEVEQIPEGGA